MVPSFISPVIVTPSLVPGFQIFICATGLAPLLVISRPVTLPFCTNVGPHLFGLLQVYFDHSMCSVRVFSVDSAMDTLNTKANTMVVIYFIAMFITLIVLCH